MADPQFEAEFAKALEHVSDTTKMYMRAHKELLENYVERMNGVRYDIPLVHQLQKLLEKESEVLYAKYVEERAKHGLLSELGWMSRACFKNTSGA